MASRYGITPQMLRIGALNLQIGDGIANRLTGPDGNQFIEDAEEWAEDQVSDFIAVPLKPTPRRGETELPDPYAVNRAFFPREFTLAITYWAIGRMLHSEHFANEPAASEAAVWAEEQAQRHIVEFKDRATVLVGGGRRRNPNPFIPPNIAPRQERPQQ